MLLVYLQIDGNLKSRCRYNLFYFSILSRMRRHQLCVNVPCSVPCKRRDIFETCATNVERFANISKQRQKKHHDIKAKGAKFPAKRVITELILCRLFIIKTSYCSSLTHPDFKVHNEQGVALKRTPHASLIHKLYPFHSKMENIDNILAVMQNSLTSAIMHVYYTRIHSESTVQYT